MNKLTKGLALGTMALVSCATLAACGGPRTLWQADFSNGNSEVFGIYGEIVNNNDDTITLKPDTKYGAQSTAGSTYFGEADKNYDWKEGGMSVNFKVYVDEDVIQEGKHVVWTLALNEKYAADEDAGTEEKVEYLTELPVFFVGTADGVKFVYNFTGVDQDDYTALVSGEDAVTLATGYYTVGYDFNVDEDNNVLVTVTLKDNSGKEVYKSADNTFDVIDSTQYSGEVKEEMIEGLRYLWCVRTTTDVKVASVQITE